MKARFTKDRRPGPAPALRAPQGLQEAIEAAARQRHTNPSEWARQALLGALAADGVHLLPDGKIENRAA